MKIGIIGLRANQITEVRARHRIHTLEFLEPDGQSPTKAANLSKRNERVVIMVGHVGKDVINATEKDKRHCTTGSVSSLLAYLSGIPADREPGTVEPAPAPVQTKVRAELVRTSRIDVEASTATPPTALSAPVSDGPPVAFQHTIPPDFNKAYVWPEHPKVYRPDKGGEIDYKVLLRAKVGEVYRFYRQGTTETKIWIQRVSSIRSYYRRTHGIVIEVVFYKDFADFLVRALNNHKVHSEVLHPGATSAPAATTAEEPAAEPAPLDASQLHDLPPSGDVPGLGTPATVSPEAQEHYEQQDRDMAALLAKRPDDRAMTFWSEVYIALLTTTKLPEGEIARQADIAMQSFRTRFE